MTTQSKTFCSAPWTSLNIDQTGRVMPCMHSSYELGNIKQNTIQDILIGHPLRDLKRSIDRGEWHPACVICKQLEETTGESGRTARVIEPEIAREIDAHIDWFGLEHVVINWSNLCNITCTYCNPETSTAWQSVKRIPINHVKNEHEDLVELAKTHGSTIKGLTLGGGEPLLQKGLERFLNCLNPASTNVLVTTNLSTDLQTNAIYQILKQWPQVSWMISFDNANRDKFEYVRHGASWQQFERNIEIMKQDKQKNVIAHPAYSIYNALDLITLYEYCEHQDIDLYWCDLSHPWDLDIRRYPKHLRDLAIAEIDNVVARWGDTIRAIPTLLRYRMHLVDNTYLVSPEYQADAVAFHRQSESELKQSHKFIDLWPAFR